MGKYNTQIENAQGFTMGDHAQVTMNFGKSPDYHGKQKGVDEVGQLQLRYLHARFPERVKVADKIPLQAQSGAFICSKQKYPPPCIFSPHKEPI